MKCQDCGEPLYVWDRAKPISLENSVCINCPLAVSLPFRDPCRPKPRGKLKRRRRAVRVAA